MLTMLLCLIGLFLLLSFAYYCLGGWIGVAIVVGGVIIIRAFQSEIGIKHHMDKEKDMTTEDMFYTNKAKSITFKK